MAALDLKLKREPKTSLKAKVKVVPGLKMAQILEAPEEEFAKIVKRVESSPLFQNLLIWGCVKRKPFPGVSPAFFQKISLEENRSYGGAGISTSTLSLDEETMKTIERLGKEKFTAYFLVPEKMYTVKEISSRTGLQKKEIERIADFVNDFQTISFTVPPIPHPPSTGEKIRVIASVRIKGKEPMIEDLSFNLCRGRYQIDQARLEDFKQRLAPGEKRKLSKIISQLQWINTRRSILFLILEYLFAKQRHFLLTGSRENLAVLTQRQLSRDLGLSPSVVSRMIKKRALRMANGKIVPLKDFFPGNKERVRKALKEILARKKSGQWSDSEIKTILEKEYGIIISRRTVNWYHHSLH